MNNICVKAESLSKRFFVLERKETALRALMVLIKRELFKRELWVLRDISFEIKKGEKVAIIGKNGSGKTTLIRILTGIYGKTSGNIEVKVEPKALFRSSTGFNIDLSIIDNIYLFGAVHGMERNFLTGKIDRMLELAGLYPLRFSPLKHLSAGQIQRLALSVFFQNTSDFLIFDECLAFIDQSFVQKCEVYFKDLACSEKTVVIITHDNSFLKKYCRTAIWLDEGNIRMYGDAESVISEYERFSNE